MGSITQSAPSTSISSTEGLTIEGTYTRAVPTDALGVLDRIEAALEGVDPGVAHMHGRDQREDEQADDAHRPG